MGIQSSKNARPKKNEKLINLKTVEYILGPFSLTYLISPRYRKRIYVFGEVHGNVNKCSINPTNKNILRIEDYLYQTILQSPFFIDLFIESSSPSNNLGYLKNYESFLLTQDKKKNSQRINNIETKFLDCIGYANRINTFREDNELSSICRKMRYHYIETTQFEENDFEFLSISDKWKKLDSKNMVRSLIYVEFILSKIDLIKKYQAKGLKPEGFKINIELLYESLLFLIESKPKDIVYSLIEGTEKIKKQMNNLIEYGLDEVVSVVTSWAINYIKKAQRTDFKYLQRNFMYIEDILIMFKDVYETEGIYSPLHNFDEEIWQGLRDIYLFPRMIIFDMYAFMRFFKNFIYTELNPLSEIQPPTANNIIIYAGNTHSQHYRYLFYKLGFTTIDTNYDQIYEMEPEEFDRTILGKRILEKRKTEGQFKDQEKDSDISLDCLSLSNFNQPFFSSDTPTKRYNILRKPEEEVTPRLQPFTFGKPAPRLEEEPAFDKPASSYTKLPPELQGDPPLFTIRKFIKDNNLNISTSGKGRNKKTILADILAVL